MESSKTIEQLVADGKRLLEAGDKPGALEQLVMATDLAPGDEAAWLLRAKASDDPKEAVDSLEHALSINPENARAREDLIYLRMHGLQEGVRGVTETVAVAESKPGVAASVGRLLQSPWVRVGLPVFVLVFCGLSCLLLFFVWANFSNSDSQSVAANPPAPTQQSLILPPLWTPTPTRAPTSTPLPSPIPSGKARISLTVRAGPGVNFPRLGTLPQDSTMRIIGRSSDGKYIAIEYPNADKPGWVAAEYVVLGGAELTALAIMTPLPITPAPTRQPVVLAAPTTKPTNTPISQADFILGRAPEFVIDCNQQWRIAGTVYSNQSGAQRLNGILVRIWAFGQIQGTITTGNIDYLKPGYWEWTFNPRSDVQGEVAIVNADGSLRSQPVTYRLTAKCDGISAATQIIIDFVGVR